MQCLWEEAGRDGRLGLPQLMAAQSRAASSSAASDVSPRHSGAVVGAGAVRSLEAGGLLTSEELV